MRRAFLLAALLAQGGCDDGTGANSNLPAIRLEGDSWSVTTDNNARAEIDLDVPQDAVSFQVTGNSRQFVGFDTIIDPSGTTVLDSKDWLGSNEQVTLSFFPQRQTTALNWPIRGQDGPLTPGLWKISLFTTDDGYYYRAGVDVDVATELKYDPDFTTGHVSVQVVWADGVDQEPGVADAVEAATARWAEIWGKAGIEVSYYYVTSKLDPKLRFYKTGDPSVTSVAEKKNPGDLELVIGDMVANQQNTFGVSAGIPGTVEPSPSTYVVLAWMTHAGPDGKFDQDEIRLMGETMAHECAHYTGLFHPVESTYDAWDALNDTPECKSGATCDAQLGQNVMYPYPICAGRTCNPQGQLTGEQATVMNQFVGAL